MTLAVRDPFPFDHLSLKEAWEFERLDAMATLTGKNAVRFSQLYSRKYWPPPVSDADKGAA
jgi:hypothetical protein